MGTKYAPGYANVFMVWFKEKFIPISDKLKQFLFVFYRQHLSNLEWN